MILPLRPARRAGRPAVGELDRHLMRARRREEPADVLHAAIEGRAGERLLACFRLTDSVEVRRGRGGVELTAVFDADGLEREALERRLRAAAGGAAVRIAWARFPDDGVTLTALREVAR